MRRLFLLPLLLILTACAGDKFPYPPQFVTPETVGMGALPAPPEPYSKTYTREIAHILEVQGRMTQADKDAVMAEDSVLPSMIVLPVLGERYTESDYPALYALLRRTASDAWRVGDATQEHWQRTRPWLMDERVALYVKPITRPSYPSGHSTTNHVWAHVLSELFPHKRAALFTRAYAVGMHRMKGGVHFPSDVEAGKKLAAAIYTKMRTHPDYQAALAQAHAELKSPRAANDNVPVAVGAVARCC
jgi:acid phosphatase (class A)